MAVFADLRAFAHRHPDLAELGLGVAVGVAVVAVGLSQTGFTDSGLIRSLSFAIPLAVFSSWRYRTRRQNEERRQRRLLEGRVALARELHDAVAGQVAVVGIQAAAARLVLTSRPAEAAEALERIEVASRAAVADLRRMLVALREGAPVPATAEPGLADVERLAGPDVAVTRSGPTEPALPRALDVAAYRIVQEALTNATRHGAGGPTTVEIGRDADALVLRVRNAARGGLGRWEPGFGIAGMRERAELLGGSLLAGPTAAGDWLVEARLPVADGT